MADCIPVWLSAPLETHLETSPFTVRLSCQIKAFPNEAFDISPLSSSAQQLSLDLLTTSPLRPDQPRSSSSSKRCPLTEEHRSQVLFYSGNKMGTKSGRRSASRLQVTHPAFRSATLGGCFHSPHQQINECICSTDPLVITNLKQYTSYTVRLAASNAVGVGHFSENKPVRTMGIRKCNASDISAILCNCSASLTFPHFPSYMKTSTNQHLGRLPALPMFLHVIDLALCPAIHPQRVGSTPQYDVFSLPVCD